MSNFYLPKISRRTTLQWIAASVAGAVIPARAQAEQYRIYRPIPQGYGTDPNLKHPVIPWDRIMTPHQLQLTAVFGDLLLPPANGGPSPSTLGVPDFVNEWVSAPYPDQVRDRPIVLDGLASLDQTATGKWKKDFLNIGDAERQEILDGIIAEWQALEPPKKYNSFFYRFRSLVFGAYYTTPEGFKEIEYLGNVPMESYPAATEEESAILSRAFKKLGI